MTKNNLIQSLRRCELTKYVNRHVKVYLSDGSSIEGVLGEKPTLRCPKWWIGTASFGISQLIRFDVLSDYPPGTLFGSMSASL